MFSFCYGKDICIGEIHSGLLQSAVSHDITGRFPSLSTTFTGKKVVTFHRTFNNDGNE